MTTSAQDPSATFAGKPIGLQCIGGAWRDGSSGRAREIINPYDDSVVATIVQADAADLDEAYTAAEAAQAEWASRAPSAAV